MTEVLELFKAPLSATLGFLMGEGCEHLILNFLKGKTAELRRALWCSLIS